MSGSNASLLRLVTCGSVDDGKSTLIGRLLADTGNVPDDQLAALRADSRRNGWPDGTLDWSLLLDGLAAEREQGITIDVAYRFFHTPHRRFIVADTPGHEQYTRNMLTGASTADVALVLVDARQGLVAQTRRHLVLASLVGLRSVLVAVNKMDQAGWSRQAFEEVDRAVRDFAGRLGIAQVQAIPVSAVLGANLVTRSPQTPWYEGPPVMSWLESVEIDEERLRQGPLRLPVQWVNRASPGGRGLTGMLASGRLRVGDEVQVQPSGQNATVQTLRCGDEDLAEATALQSVTLTLSGPLDVSRGDMLCGAEAPAPVADRFEATIVWLADAPLLPGRSYLMKIGTRTAIAAVTPLKHRLDIDTLAKSAASTLGLNEIGVAGLELDRPVPFDPYDANRDTGGFILIDRQTMGTVGAGMIRFALRRSANLRWQATRVDRPAREALGGHRGAVVWLTGLSGAGKSTVADLLEQRLHAQGVRTYLLDGDNVRHGLNKDLGFTAADRVENVRRVAEVARLMVDAGLVVITALISPFREERRMARELFEAGRFVEVFVDAPLAVAEARDPKGLYRKARAGDLTNFTGIDSPYEPPEAPDLRLDTASLSPEDAADAVLARLQAGGLLGRG
jgi:bifunctional enzyme CysN/CysC